MAAAPAVSARTLTMRIALRAVDAGNRPEATARAFRIAAIGDLSENFTLFKTETLKTAVFPASRVGKFYSRLIAANAYMAQPYDSVTLPSLGSILACFLLIFDRRALVGDWIGRQCPAVMGLPHADGRNLFLPLTCRGFSFIDTDPVSAGVTIGA